MIKKSKGRKQTPVRSKKTTVDGIVFDSKMESDYYIYLKEEKKNGEVLDFKVQPCFELVPAYVKNGRKVKAITYSPDYEVTYKDGTIKYIDVKGRSTEVFKLKRKMFDFTYPDLILELVIYIPSTGEWKDYDQHKKDEALRKRRATLAKKGKNK